MELLLIFWIFINALLLCLILLKVEGDIFPNKKETSVANILFFLFGFPFIITGAILIGIFLFVIKTCFYLYKFLLYKPFRVRLGEGTPVRELPANPSDLPEIPKGKINSIATLRKAIKEPAPKKDND